MSEQERLKSVHIFTQHGAQFQVLTRMSFTELDTEMGEVNSGFYVNILGEDEAGDRVTLNILRSVIVGYMYGFAPAGRMVQPARPGLVQ